MAEKKKICFYSFLTSGHLNVCASIGSLILDKYPNIEIWFVVDRNWSEKISKIDSRFKLGVFEYEDPKEAGQLVHLVKLLEGCLTMGPLEKRIFATKMVTQNLTGFVKVDEKSEEVIRKIKPDFLICDQGWHLPAMIKCGVPYAFLASANPLFLNIDGFPQVGSDSRMDDKESIAKFAKEFEPHRLELVKSFLEMVNKRGAKFDGEKRRIDQALSDHFTLYAYPQELDYFGQDLKDNLKLWQIDTPMFAKRIPKPFVLPKEFAELPGPIVYISLGTLFSAYTHLLQRICDILEKQPYKYIVSKGPNGDNLKFPSNKFIGENFVDQLAVLQVADGMIAHGGNNSLGECFYFGVPCLIIPVMVDQINNGVRIEEKGFGYQLNVLDYTEEQLVDRLGKILKDDEIRSKWKKASERIQNENRIDSVVDKIVDYVSKL